MLENKEIIELYNKGYSARKINRDFGISRKVISKILHTNKIAIRPQSKTSRLYHRNENYFDIIDNPENYFLY